mgnify:FL=1
MFLIGLVSAHDIYYKEQFLETKYYPRDNVVFSRTSFVDYDNDDRFSTYDYRHGYSYRTTREYFEDRYDYDRDYMRARDYDRRDYDYRWDRGYDVKGVRYEYVPYLRNYEARECYLSPPVDRLFYVKC